MKDLEEENKKYFDTLIKHSKGKSVNIGNVIDNGKQRFPPAPITNQESPPKIEPTKEFTYTKFQSKGAAQQKKLYKGLNISGQIGKTQIRNLSMK